MDIKELLRTYTHVNDPKWQQVTVKFAIFVMAALAMGAVLVALASFQQPLDAPGDTAPAAETADGTTRECLQAGELATWEAEHPDVEIISRTAMEGQRVCITYRV
ncbi:MAG: hypothetical protein R3185_04685 [Candidatus Thermoplasmatota archaeon]|nr:hypothetical protein [Candidatus Thermoplasmatota archaeon]